MKLTQPEIEFIQLVVKTAQSFGIDQVIIEPNKVRAMDSKQSIILFQDKGVPTFQFGSIGINRIELFQTRLDLVYNLPNFEAEIITNGEDSTVGFDVYDISSKKPVPKWVRSITMKSNKTKLDYRCANPQILKAPKIRASNCQFKFNVSPELVRMLQKGKAAMKSNETTIRGNSAGVFILISDINGDVLEYLFADKYVALDGKLEEFSYKYQIDQLLPLLQANPSGVCSITSRGQLMITINSLDVYLLPKG
ncbi:MAG: hypothetical protein ACXW2E_00845 [Nitrososphaeraceae archaeon]